MRVGTGFPGAVNQLVGGHCGVGRTKENGDGGGDGKSGSSVCVCVHGLSSCAWTSDRRLGHLKV